MWGCEDERMWRYVKIRRCFTDPHYWKNPALRRSREKNVCDKVVYERCCVTKRDGVYDKVVCERWCVWKLCVKESGWQSCVWKLVYAKAVCERWCGERWCVTKWCVKDGVVKNGVWQSCVKDGVVKDGVRQSGVWRAHHCFDRGLCHKRSLGKQRRENNPSERGGTRRRRVRHIMGPFARSNRLYSNLHTQVSHANVTSIAKSPMSPKILT